MMKLLQLMCTLKAYVKRFKAAAYGKKSFVLINVTRIQSIAEFFPEWHLIWENANNNEKKTDSAIDTSFFFFSSFWEAAQLINTKLNCYCFRLTRVIRLHRGTVCLRSHRHTIRKGYILAKSSSHISLNLNNTAAVSIIDSCKSHGETVKSLTVGRRTSC